MAQPERVSYGETKAREFVSWGFAKNQNGLVESYPQRVTRYHRWINMAWGKDTDKLIDVTGVALNGLGFSIEEKTWDTRAGNGRFEFSRINPNQHAFLTRDWVHSAMPYLWLSCKFGKEPGSRRKTNYRMYLIPWIAWLDVENTFTKVFQNGLREPWKSISYPWVSYYFQQYMLEEVRYRDTPGGVLKAAYFTREELAQNWRDPRGLPRGLPLSYLLERNSDDRKKPDDYINECCSDYSKSRGSD